MPRPSTDERIKRQALSLLKKARRWFNSEDRLVKDWTKMAEDADGREVPAYSPFACRRCIIGGAYIDDPDSKIAGRAHQELLAVAPKIDLYERHPLSVVHRIYDRAIARLEKELRWEV